MADNQTPKERSFIPSCGTKGQSKCAVHISRAHYAEVSNRAKALGITLRSYVEQALDYAMTWEAKDDGR